MKFRSESPVSMEYENTQQKNGIFNNRKNSHNIITRVGLNDKIQVDNQKNTMGQEQPIRMRESDSL